MRGSNDRSGELFAYVGIEDRLRPDHPLRTIRTLMDVALLGYVGASLQALYSKVGRPSIPPDMLAAGDVDAAAGDVRCRRSIGRSERQLMERLEFDLLFRSVRRPIRREARDFTTEAAEHAFLLGLLAALRRDRPVDVFERLTSGPRRKMHRRPRHADRCTGGTTPPLPHAR